MNQPIEFVGVALGILVTVLGTVGNIATIATITSNRKLLTVSTAFIVNLSVADLLYSAVLQPITVHSYIAGRWEFGPVFCSVFGYVLFLLFGVSELTLCAVALNRYFLIVHPSKYRSIYNKTGTTVMIGVSWLLPALSLLPPALGVWGRFTFFDKVSTCSFDREVSASFTTALFSAYCIVPTVVMCFSYACILRTVRTSANKFSKKKRVHKRGQKNNNMFSDASELNSLSEGTTVKTNGKKPPDVKISVDLEMDDVFIVAGSDSTGGIKRCTASSPSSKQKQTDKNSNSNPELNNDRSPKEKRNIGTRTSSLITIPNLTSKSKKRKASLRGRSFRRNSLGLDHSGRREISPSRAGRARAYFSETDPTSNLESVGDDLDDSSRQQSSGDRTDPDSSARRIRAQNRVSRNVRLAKMTFAVFVAFSLCFLPYMVLSIVDKANSGQVWLYKLCAMVAWLNACINPIIYSLMNKQLRNGLFVMLGKCRAVLTKTVTGQDF
ncbi:G-protein coupled receptor 84-like [Branchiostoma floridae]|uniref:G-protein coupled receptor 84-like n=1 Tax=Branchiostoma floridae TaxID=7739 RepID=A0A9J7N6P4_BRAFL|nr:G-protein coupled receptor 84-like [Branchiostoma floridae]